MLRRLCETPAHRSPDGVPCEHALDWWAQSLELDPEDRAIHLRLIRALRERSELKETRVGSTPPWRASPRMPEVLLEAVETALASGAFKKAAGLAKRVLEIDPINPRVRAVVGHAHLSHARKQIAGSNPAAAPPRAGRGGAMAAHRGGLRLDQAAARPHRRAGRGGQCAVARGARRAGGNAGGKLPSAARGRAHQARSQGPVAPRRRRAQRHAGGRRSRGACACAQCNARGGQGLARRAGSAAGDARARRSRAVLRARPAPGVRSAAPAQRARSGAPLRRGGAQALAGAPGVRVSQSGSRLRRQSVANAAARARGPGASPRTRPSPRRAAHRAAPARLAVGGNGGLRRAGRDWVR
ncbi:MAG: hypothetical protein M0C28_32680 [Candidatus Moduliflexus flocculans]|nr:hypothetical protein [Candidatus Moduliflexus flocculans]